MTPPIDVDIKPGETLRITPDGSVVTVYNTGGKHRATYRRHGNEFLRD